MFGVNKYRTIDMCAVKCYRIYIYYVHSLKFGIFKNYLYMSAHLTRYIGLCVQQPPIDINLIFDLISNKWSNFQLRRYQLMVCAQRLINHANCRYRVFINTNRSI